MEFRAKNFDFTLEGINKKLGISKKVYLDYNLDYGCVIWESDIETREWGIKSILSYIKNYEIVINYTIEKSELTSKEIQHLLNQELGEFYPCEESDIYIIGKIRIDNKIYNVNNEMEFAGDMFQINEVSINFNDNVITVI